VSASYSAAAESRQKILVVTTLTAQQPLRVAFSNGNNHTVQLTSKGGSGTGIITYTVSNGTATGCAVNHAVLTSSTPGTCVVTATKAASSTYAPVSSPPTVVSISFTSTTWRVTGFSGVLRGGKTTMVTLRGTGNFSHSSVKPVHGWTIKVVKRSSTSLKLRVKVSTSVKPGVYALVLKDTSGATTRVYVVMTRARHAHATIGRLRLTR
jgi:hypothetical protein